MRFTSRLFGVFGRFVVFGNADELSVGEGNFGSLVGGKEAFGHKLLHDLSGLLLAKGRVAAGWFRSRWALLFFVHCLAIFIQIRKAWDIACRNRGSGKPYT